MTKIVVSKVDQTIKGSALYVAGILSSAGMVFIATEGKEIFGIVCLVLSAGVYLAREFFLKK